MTCQIIVKSDFGGYFEGIARELLAMAEAAGGPKRAERIEVTAGPYRSYDWQYEWDEATKTMRLDFYSAVRNGFGSISKADMAKVAEYL